MILAVVAGLINIFFTGDFVGRDNYTYIGAESYGDTSVLTIRQDGYEEGYWAGQVIHSQYHKAYCKTEVLESLSERGGYTLEALTTLGIIIKEDW